MVSNAQKQSLPNRMDYSDQSVGAIMRNRENKAIELVPENVLINGKVSCREAVSSTQLLNEIIFLFLIDTTAGKIPGISAGVDSFGFHDLSCRQPFEEELPAFSSCNEEYWDLR